MQDDSLMENKECFKMAVSAMKYHSIIFTQPFTSSRATERGEDAVVLIRTAEMEVYSKLDMVRNADDPIDLTYETEKLKFKLSLSSCSLVKVNNFLYLFATVSDTFTPVTQRYDGSSGIWIDLAPVPRPATVGTTAACVNDTVYLVGGRRLT